VYYRDRSMSRTNAVHTLSIEEAQGLSSETLRWLRALGWLPPMAGGDGTDDDSSAGDDDTSDSSDADDAGGDDSVDDDTSDSTDDSGDSGDSSDDDSRDDDDRVPLTRSEYERLKRIAREHDRDKKRRDREEQKNKDRLKKEQGQYEELIAEKEEQIKNTEAERDEARYQLDAYKRRVRVTEAAKRLGFKDPDDAFRFLSDEDTEDEVSTERALKRLSKSKAYLVADRRATGAPVGGDGGVTLTLEQIQQMKPEEINARWEEVQKAMAGAP
jgi:hypothetical protein